MRKCLTFLLSPLMWLLSKIFNYKLGYNIKRIRDFIYTLWLSNFMGGIGKDTTIAYPCILEGGGMKNIRIGNSCHIKSHCVFGCWTNYKGHQSFSPEIRIGNGCSIGEFNQITACGKISIGDGLLTGRFVYIGDNSHGSISANEISIPPADRPLNTKGEVAIGDNVWIGDKVTILPGVKIGDGAIVGANSVVAHDVPRGCVVAGIPAKVIKEIK